MSKNETSVPPMGNSDNNNENNKNNKKRKPQPPPLSVPESGDKGEHKKRRTDSPPAGRPSAQPGFRSENLKMTGSPASVALSTPLTGKPPGTFPSPMDSTAFPPQYSQCPAQFPPPPQYPPPPPMQRPGFNMQPMLNFSKMHPEASQQQMKSQAPTNPQHIDSTAKLVHGRPNKLFGHDEVAITNPRDGRVPNMQPKAQPNTTNIIAHTRPITTIVSTSCGSRVEDVLGAEVGRLIEINRGEPFEYKAVISPVPIMGPSKPEIKLLQPGSDQPIVTTKKGGRRQKPGTNSAQPPAQPPAPAPGQPQAPSNGQGNPPCDNCGKNNHAVGDCVGPPNPVHGDLPACPICDTFAGRSNNATGPTGHQFDDCRHVQLVLDRHGWHKDCRFEYQDLAGLGNDELGMFFDYLVLKRLRKAPIRTKLVCWFDILRETARRSPNLEISGKLKNMTPWTKDFAIQQHKLNDGLTKPWDRFNYACRDLSGLARDPIEQILTDLHDVAVHGLPELRPQIFISSDRRRWVKSLDAERESEQRREERRSLTTDRDRAGLELIQNGDSLREERRADANDGASHWQTTLNCVFQYLAGLNPVSSVSYDRGYKGVNHERLMRPLTYFLSRGKKRDRFTAFLEDVLKPDGWYCVGHICSSHHSGFEPVDGKCVRVHEYSECPLQVRHLDAHSGGRTLDFRIEAPDGNDDDGEEG